MFNTTVDIQSGLQHNRIDVLNKTQEIIINLNEFPQLKELKDSSEEKINSLNEMISNIKDAIEERSKTIDQDSKMYKNLLENEKELLTSIQKQKGKILEIINNLESTENNLNYKRKDLKEKINKETENYSKMLKECLENLESKFKLDSQKLREDYQNEIKGLKINSDKIKNDESGRKELIKSLSDITNSRRIYKDREIQLLKEKMFSEYSKLIKQHELILKLNSEHKTASNEYQKIKLEEFNMLNMYFSFDKVVEAYSKTKQELTSDKLSEYNSRLYDVVNNQIRPEIKEKLLEKNISDMLKIIDKSFEKSEYLGLGQNKKFLSDLYKSKNSVILFLLKYLIHKQKEKPLNEFQSSYNYSEMIKKNYEKLYQLSSIFEDDYTRSVLENSSLFQNRIHSKSEMLNDFDKIKSDLLFDIIFYNKKKQSNFLLPKFFIAHFFSKFTNVWFNLYDPVFNQINEEDSEVVKKIKALNFLDYYLKNENYLEAYHYLKYLIKEHHLRVKELSDKIEVMTKHEIVIDLLENHFAF